MLMHSIPTIGDLLSTAIFLRPVFRIPTCSPGVIGITFYRRSTFIGQCDQRTLIIGISVHQAVFAVVPHQHRTDNVVKFKRTVSNIPTILYLVLQILIMLQIHIYVTPNLIHYLVSTAKLQMKRSYQSTVKIIIANEKYKNKVRIDIIKYVLSLFLSYTDISSFFVAL